MRHSLINAKFNCNCFQCCGTLKHALLFSKIINFGVGELDHNPHR